MGAKARSLGRLQREGFAVPPFFVVAPGEALDERSIAQRCARLADGDSNARFAVRSSAQAEDGAAASYAGMFETYLFVPASDVVERVKNVRACGAAARVAAYAGLHGGSAGETPSAIVQRMVDADVAGVAFGRDPVDGSDRVVIAAAYGLGSGIVGGDCNADTFRVARDGAIVEQVIARKDVAHRRAARGDGTTLVAVAEDAALGAALTPQQVFEVAATVRRIGASFGSPQDVEWAFAGGRLFVLQARPVTTPAGIVWDNSNISESYGGLVSPLTFSFARYAYAGAYRQLMHAFAIPERTIDAHANALENLLGLIDGRIYYNLLNWYRLLALVPGFRLNRRFMEGMMGVREALPEEVVREIESTGKARDLFAALRTLGALMLRQATLRGEIRRFHQVIDRTLAASPPVDTLDLAGLDADYARLEACLLANWETPLVNDFFAMLFYGVLRRLGEAWCDAGGSIHNDLLCAQGEMISVEPAHRIAELAALARCDAPLLAALAGGDAAQVEAEIARHPDIAQAYGAYIARFGDRCQSELKLESPTLHDDPVPLFRSIARLARAEPPEARRERGARDVRVAAQARAADALRGHPVRAAVFGFVLQQARTRLSDRENLRFERTRVFGRVRNLFTAIGQRLHAIGVLAETRDVFYLELEEARAAATGRIGEGLTERAAQRRQAYAAFAAAPAPPDRFTSISASPPPPSLTAAPANDGAARSGIGCCPGVVRARVRVVRDPQTPLEAGEILVAERTDPGWIVLFPAAAGILVEYGSVLSHAAIVSREMGIPSIVGIAGLTSWLRDGDLVEFDGRGGTVVRLEPAQVP